MRVQEGVELYLYSFFHLDTRCVGGKATPLLLYVPEGDPVPIVQADGWTQGLSEWVRIYRHQGIRSPGRPARSESLYRLLYADPLTGK